MDTTGYTPEEPIAAVATALAPSALGIIRASGKGVIEAVSVLFSRPNALQKASGNTIVYGWIIDPGTTPPRRIDEVLVSVFRAPKSFTGEDMIEISCHGGPAVVTEIYRLLTGNGFRPANRGEFTFRAFINGKADLTRAEAVQEIISAKTGESRNRAAGRLAGNLYNEINRIKQLLLTTLASIEAEIEYPEDEETIADAFDDTLLKTAEQQLLLLCTSWNSEKLYQDGARVILCGKTNAGKSSLFNMLLKEERAIVSDIHGTTRDWIESWISFDGIPARLFDTAGLRETTDIIEQRGVERTKDLTTGADVILYVVDSTIGLTPEDIRFMKEFLPGEHQLDNQAKIQPETAVPAGNIQDGHSGQPRIPVILVLNKTDKTTVCPAPAPVYSEEQIQPAAIIPVSAKTGAGTQELCTAIKSILTAGHTTERAGAGLGSVRQQRCTRNALESVNHGLKAAADGFPLDAVVQDIEDALDALGEITGAVTPEDILDTVFSKFCLGK